MADYWPGVKLVNKLSVPVSVLLVAKQHASDLVFADSWKSISGKFQIKSGETLSFNYLGEDTGKIGGWSQRSKVDMFITTAVGGVPVAAGGVVESRIKNTTREHFFVMAGFAAGTPGGILNTVPMTILDEPPNNNGIAPLVINIGQ